MKLLLGFTEIDYSSLTGGELPITTETENRQNLIRPAGQLCRVFDLGEDGYMVSNSTNETFTYTTLHTAPGSAEGDQAWSD